MCGIVGFTHAARPVETFPVTISRMLGMIRHRGPDEMGYFFDTQVALGAARLSIIDLATGQQPLSDGSERYWIVYNGEIYNYRELRHDLEQRGVVLHTQSDTEVLLNAYIVWGEAAFTRMNGGFACAIYDRVTGRLLLVRDRYGKRPLFYTRAGSEWVFASEVKCFLAHGGVSLAFDPAQIASILALWTPLPHESGYQGIWQVPPGSMVWLDPGQELPPQPRAYYRLTVRGESGHDARSFEDAVEQTRALLHDAVRLRLRSDVEVGTYLSGGLDSSITTHLAVQHASRPVRSFSIGFAEASFDETEAQQVVSHHLGTEHTTLRVTNAEIAAAFPRALWHAEVPVFRTALVPMYLLAERVRAAGITVVLTGEGADETFLGYDLFKETILRQHWSHLHTREEQRNQVARLYPYLARFQEHVTALVGLFDQVAQERLPGLFSHELRFSHRQFGLRLLRGQGGDGLAALRQMMAQHEEELAGQSPLQRAQWLEFKTLLAGYLLSSQGDRMSFAHGVETRMPFLDPRVVHWAWSLPTEWKLSLDGDEKHILKRAFAHDLPAAILQRPKQPYRAPDIAPFVGKDAPDYLELLRSPQELQRVGLVDPEFAQQLVQKVERTPPARVSQRESQTFLILLSLLLLHQQLIARQGPDGGWEPPAIEAILVRRIDGRQLPTLT